MLSIALITTPNRPAIARLVPTSESLAWGMIGTGTRPFGLSNNLQPAVVGDDGVVISRQSSVFSLQSSVFSFSVFSLQQLFLFLFDSLQLQTAPYTIIIIIIIMQHIRLHTDQT